MKLGKQRALHIGALMEVRDMVRANGMDESRFLEILNVSTGRSWFSENVPLPPERVRPCRSRIFDRARRRRSTCRSERLGCRAGIGEVTNMF